MAIKRIYFYADDETDADVFAWLDEQGNRSEALRALIREYSRAAAGSQAPGASIDEDQLRRVLREELGRLAPGLSTPPPATLAEDDDLRDAIDDLVGTWQFEEG